MQFIPVISKVSEKDLYPAIISTIIKEASSCLFSLISAFENQNFGLDTMYKIRRYLKEFNKEYVNPHSADLFIDSGGYSFIKGKIHELDLIKMIECYCDFLEKEKENIKHIFSLDLPWSLKYPLFNTKDKVYHFNRISILKSLEIIQKYPELANRFYFIWQFRKEGQYEIFKKIYQELVEKGLSKYIHNRSIGGMVGIKGFTGINFAPFIALSYRCFKDYMENRDFTYDFRLHLLGISSTSDRFMIALLERISQMYLEKASIQAKAVFTYDSISYNLNANYFAKELLIYDYNDEELIIYPTVGEVPENLLKKIYTNEELYYKVKEDIKLIGQGKRLKQPMSMVPLNLYSCNSIDRYFEDTIKKYSFTDIVFQSKSRESLFNNIQAQLTKLQKLKPNIFTRRFNNSIIEGVNKLFRLHEWYYDEGAIYPMLDVIIQEFIKLIDDPGKLK